MTPDGRVERLAALARISVPKDMVPQFEAEFTAILGYMDQLEALSSTMTSTPPLPVHRNVFRDDSNPTAPGTWTPAIVDQFPQKSGQSLVVKKILSHD